MRHLLLLLFSIPILAFSQTEVPNVLYEVVNITPKSDATDAFEAAVKSHNSNHHTSDTHGAFLIYVINGPHAGTYNWIMAMPNYAAFETRPTGDDHDQDWQNVAENIESVNFVEHWKRDTKLTQLVDTDNAKAVIWIYDVKPGEMARWKEKVGMVTEVYKEKYPTRNFEVVYNQFGDTRDGRDAAVIFSFGDWSFMDEDIEFNKSFEEVHGPGSWHVFLNAMSDVTNGRIDWLQLRLD